jgi:hypothetical protein
MSYGLSYFSSIPLFSLLVKTVVTFSESLPKLPALPTTLPTNLIASWRFAVFTKSSLSKPVSYDSREA